MTWMLKLYPRAWRERYGAEIEEVVSSQRPSLQLAVDLLGGAIDAHIKPQALARRLEAESSGTGGGSDMVSRLLACERRDSGDLSMREAMISGSIAIGAALAIAAAMFLTDDELVKTILLTMSPGFFVLGSQWYLLRGHSLPARLALIAAPMVVLFLIGLAAGLWVTR